MDFYQDKGVVIAGGLGMVGRQLTDKLIERGAKVRVVDIRSLSNNEMNNRVEYLQADLTEYKNCLNACENIDIAFNVMCHKGSPKAMLEKPASFFDRQLLYNTNFLRAAHEKGVKRFEFTSSVGVYSPFRPDGSKAEIFYEDDVWKTMPSEKDWYGGWAKRMGELQTNAYKIEHKWKNISIARPANVYGPFDNFNPDTAMFVSAIISKAIEGDNPLKIMGDGSNIRDFIHSEDIADALLFVVENNINEPVNVGSGRGHSVREIVDIVTSNLNNKPDVYYDASIPSGDLRRILDTSKLQKYGFTPKISLEEGISKTMKWYKEFRKL